MAPRRGEIVEYAICLPGKEDGADTVYLPIDSKFPMESYIRLTEAAERGEPAEVDTASRQLEASIKENARSIRDKYIVPPHTTDFAIMFLPTEGLYAEVTRRAELCTVLQRDYRVTIMGPTTLGAFLNSLQMGFRTLAIQKRSGEVWKMLGAIKVGFRPVWGRAGGDAEKAFRGDRQFGQGRQTDRNHPEQAAKRGGAAGNRGGGSPGRAALPVTGGSCPPAVERPNPRGRADCFSIVLCFQSPGPLPVWPLLRESALLPGFPEEKTGRSPGVRGPQEALLHTSCSRAEARAKVCGPQAKPFYALACMPLAPPFLYVKKRGERNVRG